MAGTRRSARVASSGSAPVYNEDILEGKIPRSGSTKKRKTESGSSPAAKRGKKASEGKQQTLEESLDDSKAAPSKREGTEDAELAEVIEKSKIEVSDPNGEHEPSKPDPEPQKDAEMTDAPVAQDESAETAETAETAPADPDSTDTLAAKDKTEEPVPADPEPAEMNDAPAAADETEESAPTDRKPDEEPFTTDETEGPAPVDAKPAGETSAKAEPQPSKPDDLSEPAVEVEAGVDQPFAENGVPDTKTSEEAPPTETNGTGPEKGIDEQSTSAVANGDTAVETKATDHDTPASILEKGILYFLFRGRVGVDDPQDVKDIARSFLLMRPLPHDARLGAGPIGDAGNCRLLALPKKVLPSSGKDRFLSFVEKSMTSFAGLKSSFSASEYETKTLGTRHTPAMTPLGEAVYAMTTTGRVSHLAYILTIPDQLSEVQKDIGLKERGSFIISTKNPETPAPAGASLPKGPEYPKEILEEFCGLRWTPTQPKHLEFANAQILMIGESHGIDKATEIQPEDEKKDKDTPLEEIEKLEGEDEIRVRHLNGDDAIFADLDLNKNEFPKVPSTW